MLGSLLISNSSNWLRNAPLAAVRLMGRHMAASRRAALNRTVCIIARWADPFPAEIRARLQATTEPRSSVGCLLRWSPPTSLGQTRCYFVSECEYLLAKVTQCRRKGFDHQLLDADFAVPP